MRARPLPVLHQLARVHRMLAVPLCLMIALWFATGTVLSFVPFPSLGATARIAGRDAIDPVAVHIEPAQAVAASTLRTPASLRLIRVAGADRYVLTGADNTMVAVDARSGQILPPLDAGAARTIAGRFANQPVRAVSGPYDYDLWTQHDKYRVGSPWFRVALGDSANTELYVSARSGEVMQRTRRQERAWNRVGATVHWLNIPALRIRVALWRWSVWTLALGGIVLAVLGLVLGYSRWRAQRRARRRGFSPFRGGLRAHHVLGSCAGLFVLTWAGSGWLSLEANGWFSSPQPSPAQSVAYRGLTLAESARQLPLDALRRLPPAREYEWRAVGGQPLLQVRGIVSGGPAVALRGTDGSIQVVDTLPPSLLRDALDAAWPGSRASALAPVAGDDPYALRDAPFPAGTLRLRRDDAAGTWVHVDPHSGEIIGVMDRSRRVYRWLVDGLHTFDFPPLNRGGAWHVLLVIATAAGFALSCTGAWLAWRRLRRGAGLRPVRPGTGTWSA